MVSDPGPFSSSLETGIILLSEPSPHWWVSRLGFSFRLGPWYHGYSFLGMAGPFSGWFGLFIELSVMAGRRTGRRDKWAEYIINSRLDSSLATPRGPSLEFSLMGRGKDDESNAEGVGGRCEESTADGSACLLHGGRGSPHPNQCFGSGSGLDPDSIGSLDPGARKVAKIKIKIIFFFTLNC